MSSGLAPRVQQHRALLWALIGSCSLSAAAQAAPPARTQTSLPSVSVSGPAGCPSAEQLAAEVNRSDAAPRVQAAAQAGQYVVEFSRWNAGYDAQIRDARGRVRSLADESSDCRELGRAVALTLLVLLDEPPGAPPPPPPNLRRPEADKIPEETNGRLQAVVGVQLGVGSVLPEAAALVSGYAGLRAPLDVEAWLASSAHVRVDHGPGSVELDWLGVGARGCQSLFSALSACGGVLLARLRATGRGYDDFNQRVTRWQPALDAGLKLHGTWREVLEGRLSLLAEVPLAQERFTVSGVAGDAFAAPLVAGMLWAGLGARF